MAGFLTLNSQQSQQADPFIPDATVTRLVSVGPVSTDVDTHAVYVVATISVGSVADPGTLTVQCFRASDIDDENGPTFGVQAGPDYQYEVESTSPGFTFTVRFVDPDPPAGGTYAVTATATVSDPFGQTSAVSIVAYAF